MAAVSSDPRHVPPTLSEALRQLAHHTTRGFVFVRADGSERFCSFQEIAREAARRAADLHARGLVKGDRLAIAVPDPDEFVLSFLGAVLGGIVPVPISPQLSFKNIDGYHDTVTHIANASGASLLLTTESTRRFVEPVLARAPKLRGLVTVDELAKEPGTVDVTIEPNDLAFLQFTSGSTSRPKGCDGHAPEPRLEQRELHDPRPREGLVRGQGRHLAPALSRHGAHRVRRGHDLHRHPRRVPAHRELRAEPAGVARQDPRAPRDHHVRAELRVRARREAREGEGRLLARPLVPHAGRMWRGAHPREDVARLRREARAGPVRCHRFLPSYGMAEATLAITFVPIGTGVRTDVVAKTALESGNAIPASDIEPTGTQEIVDCGRSFPEHEVCIVNASGERLADRQVGQVLARGPSISAGYYEQPELTAETFKPGPDGKTWLYTGDLGYAVDGEIFVCGRLKDMIIVRGRNFFPNDLEGVVSELPTVRRGNVAAFSVDLGGEEGVVIAAEAFQGDAAALRSTIAEVILASFSLATHDVVVVPQGTLPRTSSGKPQRRRTRELYLDGTLVRARVVQGTGPTGDDHGSSA